jgi:hypothetical protein
VATGRQKENCIENLLTLVVSINIASVIILHQLPQVNEKQGAAFISTVIKRLRTAAQPASHYEAPDI